MTSPTAPVPLSQPPSIRLIYAKAANGVIGNAKQLPWHLPEDMAHFKACTKGCAVIMGRKTWDSLPLAFRPLPGRTNIVVTRQTDWQQDGAQTASTLQAAIEIATMASHVLPSSNLTSPTQRAIWIIGGAQIYAAALPLADWAEVTEIEQDFVGDAFAPTLGPEWAATARTRHISTNGMAFAFVSYQRK